MDHQEQHHKGRTFKLDPEGCQRLLCKEIGKKAVEEILWGAKRKVSELMLESVLQ